MWRRCASIAAVLIVGAATIKIEAVSYAWANPAGALLPGQSAAVDADLAQVVDFPVADLESMAVLAKFQRLLKHPLLVDDAATDRLKAAMPLRENLEGLSAGTSLAYCLYSAGLAFEAHADEGNRIQYVAVSTNAADRPWPIGRPADRPAREILPALFEAGGAEFDQAPLAEALTKIGGRLKATVLFDRSGLEESGIDVQDRHVSLRSAGEANATVLRQLLERGGVKGDWRIDERGRPFLWITTRTK